MRKSGPKSSSKKSTGNPTRSSNYVKKAMTKATGELFRQGASEMASSIAKSMATGRKTNKPGGKKYKR